MPISFRRTRNGPSTRFLARNVLRPPLRARAAALAIKISQIPWTALPKVDCKGLMPFLGHIIRGHATADFPDQEDQANTPSVRPTERPWSPLPSTMPVRRPPQRRRLIATELCSLPSNIFCGRTGPKQSEGPNPIYPCPRPQTKHPLPLGCPHGQYNSDGRGGGAIYGRCRR